jgi:hypothetical protein
VLRGASFNNHPTNVRASYRNNNRPTNRNNTIGVRVASTSRWSGVSGRPEARGHPVPGRVPRCQVHTVVRCRGRNACREPKEALAQVW